jgi:hypothetical protein
MRKLLNVLNKFQIYFFFLDTIYELVMITNKLQVAILIANDL